MSSWKEPKVLTRLKKERHDRRVKAAQEEALDLVTTSKNVQIKYDKKNLPLEWTPEFSSRFITAARDNKSLRSLEVYSVPLDVEAVGVIANLLESNVAGEKIPSMEQDELSLKTTRKKAAKKKSRLSILVLQSNGIGPEGAELLANALLQNTTLKKLFLPDNKIGSRGASAIARMLECNKAITHLDLDQNGIQHSGGMDLGEALKTNQTLKHLSLIGNPVGKVAKRTLIAAKDESSNVDKVLLQKPVERRKYRDKHLGDFLKGHLIWHLPSEVEEPVRTEISKLLTKHGLERLAPGFYEDRIFRIDEAVGISGERLKSYGLKTLSERKRLKHLFDIEPTLHEKTPVGQMLASHGYERYSRRFYEDGVYEVKPLTHADLKEIGVRDVEDEKAIHALFNSSYVVATRESSQEEAGEEERGADGQNQRTTGAQLSASSEDYNEEDEADKIRKWHKLYSSGAITRNEYDDAKAKVLKEL